MFVTVTVLAALVVPVGCDGNTSDVGLTEAIGAGPGGGGGGEEGVHPNRVAVADVDPSLTVTLQVDEL